MTEFKCPAPFKRAEQLKRWQESETNEQSTMPKNSSRIRFSVDCVFLAACAAGDKDEVLRLVRNGADVNTPSVDGLTALHQACIDNKLHMVEFLIKLGANVNHSDNEGWTPLHATASCGFYDIAQFLLDHGANLCAVNNEGELPVDLAEPGPTKQFLLDEIQKQGIDCEKARAEEERLLLDHAKKWYVTKSTDAELPDPKTGATPLHIAAAKGYLKVMQILLGNCGVDVDPVDLDGWTPLHASAHWGQPEAATVLVQHGADMDIKNFVGQTCFDVAAPDMVEHLQDLKDRHENIVLSIYNKQKRRPPVPEDLPSKLKKVEVQIENKFDNVTNNKKNVEKKNALNLNSFPSPVEGKPPKIGGGASSPLSPNESPLPEDEPSWRHSSRQKPQSSTINDKESPTSQPENDIILRRTPSDSEKLSPQNKVKKEIAIPPASNPSAARSMVENTNDQSETNKNSSSDPLTSKIFPGNIFKNFFKSFVPPVRDEESETQRKAHAKRVRETRRSTQGVTLDEIKSAEQLVKKKNSLQIEKSEPEITIISKKETPSADTENSQKDINHKEEVRDGEREKINNVGEPVDTETTVTIALPRSSPVKKEEEKEGESRVTTQAAQNVIQRRKRPKRRSTGVVNVDLEEITPDQSAGEGTESGSESTELSEPETSHMIKSDESNDVDYKTLYENSEVENKSLHKIIFALEREKTDMTQKIEEYVTRLATASENEKREKREKRAMERKMSEMEEELKCLHNLQSENKRLKDENGALIRVISKLSK